MSEPAAPFTALGEPLLEARVASDVARLSAEVSASLGPALSALLLTGGYGRGEGGGTRGPDGGWRPLNDYDLVAIVSGVPLARLPSVRTSLNALGARLEEELGIEVEVSPLRRETLPRLPFTLMWCELLGAPRVVAGDAAVLREAAPMPPGRLPLAEATRYLTNRAALLLWTRLEALPPARAFKFVQKAWLAAGAAALIGRGEFRVGYGARDERLATLPASDLAPVPALVARHHEATRERLRPGPAPEGDALRARVDETVDGVLATWRWLEERRLGGPIGSWSDYAARPGLFREPAGAWPKQVVAHLRLLGRRGLSPPGLLTEPPRTRVTRALPGLLAGDPPAPALAVLLGLSPGDDPRARALELWRRAS